MAADGLWCFLGSADLCRNRDTQTFDMITRSIQTYREMGTQMKRSDLHMEDSGDTFREAGPYFTAAGVLAHKRNKAITIQVMRAHAPMPPCASMKCFCADDRLRASAGPRSATGGATWRGRWCGTCRTRGTRPSWRRTRRPWTRRRGATSGRGSSCTGACSQGEGAGAATRGQLLTMSQT